MNRRDWLTQVGLMAAAPAVLAQLDRVSRSAVGREVAGSSPADSSPYDPSKFRVGEVTQWLPVRLDGQLFYIPAYS